ncbi:Desmethyl-deoxy-podophyllotoxin synthase [Linum grandiflorum]
MASSAALTLTNSKHSTTPYTPYAAAPTFRPIFASTTTNLPSRRRLPAKIYCTAESRKPLPPGPPKLPIIGNLHNMIGSLPHQALRDLAIQYGPLIHLQLGEISAAVVSNPAMAQEIMKTHDLVFADRPRLLASEIATWGSQDIAFSPHGDYWKQMKRISLTELLGPRKVKSFRAIREAEVSNLIESVRNVSISSNKGVNITEMVMNLTNAITCKTAFGYQCTDQDEFISLTKEAVSAAAGFGITDVYPSLEFLQGITGVKNKLLRLRNGLDRIFDKIIKEHKEKESVSEFEDDDEEDLMDVMLRIQGSGGLKCPITSTNIKAVLVDLFIAGTDTSSTTVEWAMSEMMKNPEVMKKAQEENSVIKETFRLHPPAPLLLPRESKRDCVVAGYEIPEKTKVIVNAWAIGRDPGTWEDPERFVPERFDGSEIDFKGMHFELIPFGAGRRICPGIAFGMANVELPVAQLLYHFDWELPDGVGVEDFDMTEDFAATMGRKNPLWLVPRVHRFPDIRKMDGEEIDLVVR